MQLKSSRLFVLILMSITSSPACMTKASNVFILLSLPLHETSGSRTSRERGYEILPGAHLAVRGINQNSFVLRGHNLQVIVIDGGRDKFEIVQQFVNLSFHQMHINIVGISGILDPKAASILVPLARHKGVLLSAITYTDQLDIPDNSDNFLSLPLPFATASVLLNFMREMNWKRIGLITDSRDAYFFGVAEMLLHEANRNKSFVVSPYIELFCVTAAIHDIIKLDARVIFVSLNAEKAVQLLCAVHEEGLVWPKYAWVFHSFQVKDLLDQQSSTCDIKNAVNGIIMIDSQLWLDPSQGNLISGITFSNYYKQYLLSLSEIAHKYNVTLRPNGYARLLYDLVWTMAIALSKGCRKSATCINQKDSEASVVEVLESYQESNNWIFNISHIRMPRPVLISTMHYSNSSIKATSFNESILETAPKGDILFVTEDPPHFLTVILGLSNVLTTAFVTLLFVLYIYFRKEPEVKATSFTVSLLIFIGTYVNMAYLSLITYSNHRAHSSDAAHDNAVCRSLVWLSGPGFSLPIVLATLLMKMLRIYHIFNNPNLSRLGRKCSDLSLALYILAILLPYIFVDIIWTFVDDYHMRTEYKIRDSYIHVQKYCTSKNLVPLSIILTVCVMILLLVVVGVAIITRKVRSKHFKDTKKVNIALFLICIVTNLTLCYWSLFRALGSKPYIIYLPIFIGHSILVISTISLLFVPKVFPPLWRRIKSHI